MDGTSIGLSRKTSYIIGTVLMAFALATLIPCGDDLFVNLPMAMAINAATGIDIVTSLIITYTILPLTIFLIGLWIYPGSTIVNLKTKFHKATMSTKRFIHNPAAWLIIFIVSWLLWQYYTDGGSYIINQLVS